RSILYLSFFPTRRSSDLVNSWVLIFTLFVSLATGILTGLAPALQAAQVDQREALQQTSRSLVGVSRCGFRSLLVVAQVACAFVLAAGSALLLKSFVRALDVTPGFDAQRLYTTNFALIGPKYEDPQAVVRF